MSQRLIFRYGNALRIKQLYWGVLSKLKRGTWRSGDTFAPTHREYRRWIDENDRLTEDDRLAIRRHIETLAHQPVISIIMPTYNTPAHFLKRAIDSVRSQLYQRWELCIADDASTEADVKRVIDRYRRSESRIKVVYRTSNGHISAASNSALDLATGEFIALLDHDDEISEHALYLIAVEIDDHPKVDLIYSDEDKLDRQGRRCNPHFKSGWNPELIFGQNYFSHLGVYRRSLVQRAGGFRTGFEGSQDHDLVLRCLRLTQSERVRHISHVLYHWRAVSGSTALSVKYKDYAADASVRALSEHLGDCAEVTCRAGTNYRVRYRLPAERPTVSIVIPTRDAGSLLKACVQSLMEKTRYTPYEIVIVDNGSEEPATLAYLQELSASATVVRYNHPFNYSAINNLGVKSAAGSLVCFMNNDVTIIDPEWLDEMVSHAVRPGIGVVGAKLIYPDGLIQHAGIRIGLPFIAIHPYRNFDRRSAGYFSRLNHVQDVTAVTGACMMVKRDVFQAVGGFDEIHLPIAYNDVDLCLKVRAAGFRVIWTPYAELCHHESATRGSDQDGANRERLRRDMACMRDRWGDVLLKDPFHNYHFAPNRENLALAWPSEVAKPWAAYCERYERREVASA